MSSDPHSATLSTGQPPLPTQFAPAERLDKLSVCQQANMLQNSPLTDVLLNGGMHCTFILNEHRQILAASKNVLELTRAKSVEDLLGLRPGEALACIHANECPGGCGTTEFCRDCGAARAILSGLAGQRDIQECRMTRKVDGQLQAIDLQVLASPIEFNGVRQAVIVIHDISHEKRRQALERIFFHDVINLAGGMEGLLLNLRESAPPEIKEEVELSYSTLRELMEEIVSQRDLVAAERNELSVSPGKANSLRVLAQVAGLYRSHPQASDKVLVITNDSESLDLVTDLVLLRRVLGNLIKNAAEACRTGDAIRLSCRSDSGRIVFAVNNPQTMDSATQHQVFQRSFTTKGAGRGLGTYSVKLIGERLLKGTVSFTSVEGQGTTFRLSLPSSLS